MPNSCFRNVLNRSLEAFKVSPIVSQILCLLFADMPNAKGKDQPGKRDVSPFLDGGEQVFR